MAGTFEIPGDGSAIVSFVFQADKDKVESVISYAAEWLYKNNPGLYGTFDDNQFLQPFSLISAQDKLDIMNKFVASTIMEVAFREKGDAAALAAVKDGMLEIGE